MPPISDDSLAKAVQSREGSAPCRGYCRRSSLVGAHTEMAII